ncbi:MAG: SDR family NAD(P)-dependent oxidoreductase [Gemmatimonadota bacterium]|nr:SDR family NAD(P)-dependent oxidoreductase [Gemmatimonadota bacterium]
MKTLVNRVAVVTGASRGGGKGIATALGEAGATVYVTGRSFRGNRTTDIPNETIEDTAETVTQLGGVGTPVQVDHTIDEQVEGLFSRVMKEQGRLDLLVNNAWVGYEMGDGFWGRKRFWELPMRQWELMHGAGLRSHMTAARGAISIMLDQGRGLIVNTTSGINPDSKFHPNLFYDTFKSSIYRMTHGMAEECRKSSIAVILLSLGDEHQYMRTWEPDDNTNPEDLEKTFTPVYAGRAIAALAVDPEVMSKVDVRPYLEVPDVAREYGFRDVDGRQP